MILKWLVYAMLRNTPISFKPKEVTKMEPMQFPVIILDFHPIGSLLFYTLQTMSEIQAQAPIRGIYWKDSRNPNGHGPFKSMPEALEHHKVTFQNQQNRFKVVPANIKDNISTVDFTTRKGKKPTST
jgi:hypothetical protein